MFKKAKTGFTLIEPLIVVAIIAILAAIAVPNFLEAQTRSKVARVKADLRTIATGLQAYAVDANNYPPDVPAPRYGFNDVVRLTTPVAYITTLFHDPFVPDQSHLNVRGFQYFNFQKTWGIAAGVPGGQRTRTVMTKSWGPDRADGGAEWLILGPTFVQDGTMGIWRLYDPTNGTISFGDIVRFTGETNGLPEQPN
ncbi:MAG: prepilin-type N-terminal cleavage/methylation domain-containing protein [bacterium]